MLCAHTCFASAVIEDPLAIPPITTSVIRPLLPDPVYTNSCAKAWIAALMSRVCSRGAFGSIREG